MLLKRYFTTSGQIMINTKREGTGINSACYLCKGSETENAVDSVDATDAAGAEGAVGSGELNWSVCGKLVLKNCEKIFYLSELERVKPVFGPEKGGYGNKVFGHKYR